MLHRSGGLPSSTALVAGAAAAIAALLALLLMRPLQTLQRALYDLAVQAGTPPPSDRVAVVQWRQGETTPHRYAALLAALDRAGAKAIAIAEPLSLAADAAESANAAALSRELMQTQILPKLGQALFAFESELLARADPDQPQVNALLRQWRELGLSGRFPPQLERLHALAGPTADQADNAASLIGAVGDAAPVILLRPPPPAGLDARLAAAAWAVAIQPDSADADGVLRAEPGWIGPAGESAALPAMSLAAAAAALGRDRGDLIATGDLRLGERVLRGGSHALRLRAHPRSSSRPAFNVHSAEDVLQGRVAASQLQDRVVIVGGVDAQPRVSLPGWPRLEPAIALAHRVSLLLQGQTVTVAGGNSPLLSGVLVLAALGVIAGVLAPLAAHLALTAALSAAVLLLLCEFYLLAAWSLWLPLTAPAAVLALGGLALPLARRLLQQRLSAASPEPLLSRLGRYQIDRELGRGATGIVYLGMDPKIGRQVAIKTLSLPAALDAGDPAPIKQRFFAEAAAAGRLSHPHIVQIYDAGEDRDLAYIAMELVEGQDLSRHTRPYTLLPHAEVLAYLADAAEALDYAHAQGVIHRDIKPANLLREDRSGRIKITDFGVAGVIGAGPAGGTVLGSPAYMSPEQLAGRSLDGRSDLFSLGVTAYQLLTGQLPFQAQGLAELMACIANAAHPPPCSLRRDLPPQLDALIERLLHKQPSGRHARGRDVAADLRRLY